MSKSFSELALPQAQLKNLESMSYTHMTEIQEQALPIALAGGDLIAQAQTGSGKTAAFAIALLNNINPRDFGAQALVTCPTRELCTQVANEIRLLARYLQNIKVVVLCGGQAIGPQIGSLAHGGHIIVGTPGRLRDHLRKKTLDISRVNTLVLDEADRMLDMGFEEDLAAIIEETSSKRQTLLFSATYPENIQSIAQQYLNSPEHITVEAGKILKSIQQHFFSLGKQQSPEARLEAVYKLFMNFEAESCMVFCNTKQDTRDTAKYLIKQGISALALHGDLEQRERDQVLIQFRNGSCQVLVATDVAARGLDIEQLPLVINADLPRDLEVYTHRIGRTGRAGNEGIALGVFFEQERFRVDALLERQENSDASIQSISAIGEATRAPSTPAKRSIMIAGGRKNKIRAGDILGALTAENGIDGKAIGRIDLLDFSSIVAIDTQVAKQALKQLESRRIKGQKFKVRFCGRGVD
ncbi:MAG: ATP-dependent RNA helicase DbpA [Pseudohongiellaceae bacterium]|nr:ATP-dependent RNA helicase DbpA [Pseudohongiellaceae bacterium]